MTPEELRQLRARSAVDYENQKRRGKFLLFKPHNEQAQWFASKKKVVCVICGNRRGKSTCGAIRTLIGATGVLPYSMGGTPPGSWGAIRRDGEKYLIVAESFATVIGKTIIPKLLEYLTPEMQSGRPPKKNAGTKLPEVFYLASGAEIHIQSYDQDPATFEGTNWNGVWLDEPPPQPIFTAIYRGTIDYGGWIWITATPLREPWMHDVLVKPAEDEDDPVGKHVDVFGGTMHSNCRECHGGYLPHDEIMGYLAMLSPDERAARERGEFLDLVGRTFGYVNETTHACDDIW